MSERVLVTGATGFIGRRLLPLLADGEREVHAVARAVPPAPHAGVRWHAADLLDERVRAALVAEVEADRLIHLAWYAEHGLFWDAVENAAWAAATVDLVTRFASAGGRRAVLAGTCAEYDWSAIDGPIAETDALGPATYYGACKRATHDVVTGLAARTGLSLAWGRVFFLFGPEEDERRLIPDVARRLVAGERAATTAGTQVRDFLQVDDVAGAFAALAASDVEGAVNVASGTGATVAEIVRTIARHAGREDLLDIGVLPPRPGDPPQIVADVARLRDEVGFVPSLSLDEGIAEAVRWWATRGR